MQTTTRYETPDQRYSYKSELIERLRQSGHELCAGRVTIRLAEKLGFCWGVDRAVAMVWDAIAEFPGRTIWLLNQIIHNPKVNEDFRAHGVRFVFGPFAEPGGFSRIQAGDVAVIPAFSAEVEHVQKLRELGCEIVDTTCPWVEKPHRRVKKNLDDGFTTVIHGVFGHDETRATCSLVLAHGGHYLVLRTLEQADLLCNFLRGAAGEERLREQFQGTWSPGFDLDKHLKKIGMVNQTTMLATESREIARRLGEAMRARDGDPRTPAFRDFDTICPATQDNQDAVIALTGKRLPDLFLVVGGYDSSNTANLLRAARARVGSFHVQSADSIGSRELRHRDPLTGSETRTIDWLPQGEVTVAISAGASTPDTELARVIERLVAVAQGEL